MLIVLFNSLVEVNNQQANDGKKIKKMGHGIVVRQKYPLSVYPFLFGHYQNSKPMAQSASEF